MDAHKYVKLMLRARLDALALTLKHANKRHAKLMKQIKAGNRDATLESLEWLGHYSFTIRDQNERLLEIVNDSMDILNAKAEDE